MPIQIAEFPSPSRSSKLRTISIEGSPDVLKSKGKAVNPPPMFMGNIITEPKTPVRRNKTTALLPLLGEDSPVSKTTFAIDKNSPSLNKKNAAFKTSVRPPIQGSIIEVFRSTDEKQKKSSLVVESSLKPTANTSRMIVFVPESPLKFNASATSQSMFSGNASKKTTSGRITIVNGQCADPMPMQLTIDCETQPQNTTILPIAEFESPLRQTPSSEALNTYLTDVTTVKINKRSKEIYEQVDKRRKSRLKHLQRCTKIKVNPKQVIFVGGVNRFSDANYDYMIRVNGGEMDLSRLEAPARLLVYSFDTSRDSSSRRVFFVGEAVLSMKTQVSLTAMRLLA